MKTQKIIKTLADIQVNLDLLRSSIEALRNIQTDIREIKMEIIPVKKKIDKYYMGVILDVCCEYYGVSIEGVRGKSRKSSLALVRQIFCYLSSKLTESSLREIGRMIGNKDHSTILYSIRKYNDLASYDRQLVSDVEFIEQKIKELV